MNLNKRIISICLAAMLCLAGCGIGGGGGGVQGDKPASHLPGFYAQDQQTSGGGGVVGLNLYDMEVNIETGNTVITFTFYSGSLVMGLPEEPARALPDWEITTLEGLNRMVIRLSDLAFWDYTVYAHELEGTPVLGLYRELPVESSDTYLYLSVNDAYAYQVEESSNQLVLTIKTLNYGAESQWYAVADAVADRAEGLFTGDMTPVLCGDGVHAVLVSQPFASEEVAATFADEVSQANEEALAGKPVGVLKLMSSQLPDYTMLGMLQNSVADAVLLKEGEPAAAPALTTNGRFLCWKIGGEYAFARPYFLSEGDEVVGSYEKLFLSSYDDSVEQLVLDYEFSSIQNAAFSPNGRRLAFVDQNTESRRLYIYDFDSDILISASEEGVGNDTAIFMWRSDAVLCALASDVNVTNLYTLTINAMNDYTVEMLEDVEFADGSAAIVGNTLYHIRRDYEAGEARVCAMDLETLAETEICDGYEFYMSPDQSRLAVLQDDGQGAYALSIVERASHAVSRIVPSADISAVAWDAAGEALWYTAFEANENSVDFPTGLYVWQDGQAQKAYDVILGTLFPSAQGGEMILVHVYTRDGQFIPMSYLLEQ